MKRTTLTAASVLLLATGCAGTQNAQQTETREQIANRSLYDVAACHVGADYTPPETNTEISVMGALLTTRPLVFNCLADPAHRGEAQETLVQLKATIDGETTSFEVAGDNLTEAGRTCIHDAVTEALRFNPLEEGAEPVVATLDIPHAVEVNGAVVMGINEPSDIVGTIRLAQQEWCECLGSDPHETPDSFTAQLGFEEGGTQVSSVTLFRTGDAPPPPGEGEAAGGQVATEDPVGQCLAQRLRTVTFQPTTKAWQLPYLFEFINSLSDTPATNATPNATLQQLDARRAAAQAHSIMVAESANKQREAYAGLVERYQKNRRAVPVQDMVASCKKLVEADEAFIASIEAQQVAEQRIADFVNPLAAAEADWKPVAEASETMRTETETGLANAKTQRDNDQASCPKINF